MDLLRLKRNHLLQALSQVVFMVVVILGLHRCSGNRVATSNTKIDIAPRSAWNAIEAKPYKNHVPVRVTVHHEGTALTEKDDAAQKINAIQRWGMGPDKKWADVPYHFFIAPGGTIFKGRDVYTVGETSTEYDPTGHLLICCLGNRDTDTVPSPQLKALIKLIRYANATFKISPDSLGTHKNFSQQTTCPGKYLYAYFQNGYIKEQVGR